MPEEVLYGTGFAAVYGTSRYTVFSQYLAKLALSRLEQDGTPGKRLLDLACGVGAGTTIFAQAGYEVSGIDNSEVMIEQAKVRLHNLGVSAYLNQQDIRTFALPHSVDVVVSLFDSLNYLLEESDLAQTFACVCQVLPLGGMFVFDMNTAHGLATRWGTQDIISTNRADVFEVNRHRYNRETCINTTTTTIFVRNEGEAATKEAGCFHRYTEVHRQRGYPNETLTALLHQAGMEVLSMEEVAEVQMGCAGGLRPLTELAGRVMVVARRTH